MRALLNIASNSLKRRNIGVIADKIVFRLRGEHAKNTGVDAWCAAQATDWLSFAEKLDPALLQETQQVCARIESAAQKKLDLLGMNLGGGGHYPLLYFVTRYLKARTVVETGVAAGWSSFALLEALKANDNAGHLYSSDFPYFRLKNPEQYIGYVVDDALKENWTLLIDGDKYNLPAISFKAGPVDLFHYDSDKSYSGRVNALRQLRDNISGQTTIIFDDIQDNFHFKDWVEEHKKPFRVFAFERKYIGLTGPFLS